MQVKPVMRLMHVAPLRFVSVVLLLTAFSLSHLAQTPDDRELVFDGKHRVVAHGDEFNGLAKSSDGLRLFVASEKGDAIVWNIAAGRVEQTLHQSTPIHLIAPLANPNEFVVGGSNHFQPRSAEVLKWNATTGRSVELKGVDKGSFPLALATDPKAGLIALSTFEGGVHVWDAGSNSQLASWTIKDVPMEVAVLGRDFYVLTNDRDSVEQGDRPRETAIVKFSLNEQNKGPIDYLRIPERTWIGLDVSPDRRWLAATYQYEGTNTVLVDPATKAEITSIARQSFAWSDSSKLVLFDWEDPVEVAQLQPDAPPVIRKLEPMQADKNVPLLGRSGQVANAEGSKAWATYSRAGTLLEFDLVTSKTRTLIQTRPGTYAISVDTANGEEGHLLTGGADGYVRLWKLSDISQIKEYKLRGAEYAVRDALLLPGAKRAVVGVVRIRDNREEQQLEPVEVLVLDLATGKQKKITEAFPGWSRLTVIDNQVLLPEGDRITLVSIDTGQVTHEFRLNDPMVASAVSANRHWLAAVDEERKLTLLNLNTFEQKTSTVPGPARSGPLAVTNDGRYLYVVTSDGQLACWDVTTSAFIETTLTRVREMHTHVHFMILANSDRWVITGGNHGDVGVFDRATSRLVSYTQVSTAAYAERVWVRGRRMIFTTETGVLFDGQLK